MPDFPDVQFTQDTQLGPGRLVLFVGPSGAGKDTLLKALKERCTGRSDLVFARRAITRRADDESEDHDTLSHSEFEHLVRQGEVALSWEAHGLGYVLPKSLDDDIRSGKTVIANGSRRALEKAAQKYSNFKVVLVTAPLDVLAERLVSRGRETRAEIEHRLARSNLAVEGHFDIAEIENTGSVTAGVDRILGALNL